jgi:hypothetical protein
MGNATEEARAEHERLVYDTTVMAMADLLMATFSDGSEGVREPTPEELAAPSKEKLRTREERKQSRPPGLQTVCSSVTASR